MSTLFFEPPAASGAGMLVIHSWWGQTPGFRTYGAAQAARGFHVAVADLFDGQTATTEASARALRARPRRTPMYRCLEADLSALRQRAARLGVVGFSMGGHWAVWLAQRPRYDLGATVLYYAARAGDFSHSRSKVLAHFAQSDPWVSHAARRRMRAAIRDSGRPLTEHEYPGTGHWFAESDPPGVGAPEAAALAFERSVAFLTEALHPGAPADQP